MIDGNCSAEEVFWKVLWSMIVYQTISKMQSYHANKPLKWVWKHKCVTPTVCWNADSEDMVKDDPQKTLNCLL